MGRPEESKPLQDAILAGIALTLGLILLFGWLASKDKDEPGLDNPTPSPVVSGASVTPQVKEG